MYLLLKCSILVSIRFVNEFKLKNHHNQYKLFMHLSKLQGLRRINCFSSQRVLVLDPPKFDILNTDIPENGLHEQISAELNHKYLTKVNMSQEQILKKREFYGAIFGGAKRLFVSIPTALTNKETQHITSDYLWIHYLVETGSPITTLTKQAILALKGKKNDSDSQTVDQLIQVNIGGFPLSVYQSKHLYHNANMLGSSFFQRYKQVIFDLQYPQGRFDMILK